MLNKDYAGTTAGIIRSTFPNITAPKRVDMISLLERVGNDYQTGLQRRADNQLTDEMIAQNPDDEARIRQMGGRAYADMLDANAQRAEERQWKLDDIANRQAFQREQQDRQNANARALAEFKAGMGGDSTNAQKNIAAMVEAGYTPQEAWAMYYGGNNPTLDMASLGKKGQEEYDKKMGENLAKKEALERNMPSLIKMTDELIALADKATYTPAGQARDAFNRFFDLGATEGAKAREKYKQTVANELLPKLKETYGGQLSDSERVALLATLGDVNMSGEEKKQAVRSFLEAKQRQLDSYNQPSLKQFNPANDPLNLR